VSDGYEQGMLEPCQGEKKHDISVNPEKKLADLLSDKSFFVNNNYDLHKR